MTDEDQASDVGQHVSVLDVVLTLAENLRLLIGAPLIAGLVAFGITFLIPPTYTASTRIVPPQQTQSAAASQLGLLAGVAGVNLGIKNPADLYVGMIKSRTVADSLVQRFNLRDRYGKKYIEDVRRRLAERTKVTAGKDGLIVIEVEDADPQRAADMANAYIESLRRLTQTLAVTEAGQRRVFFEEQLRKTKDELSRSEIALRASGVNEAALKTVPQSALESVARIKAQITAQEVKIAVMRSYVTESNAEYRVAQHELEGLRAALLNVQQADSQNGGGAGAEYITRFRDFKYYEALFQLIAKQYEVARLDEAREGLVVEVVDTAVPPERQSKPKRITIVTMVMLIVLAASLLIIYFRQLLRTAPGSAQKLRALLQLLTFRQGRDNT